jgi:hypothetical protein
VEREADTHGIKNLLGLERTRAELEEGFFDPPIVPEIGFGVPAHFADVMGSEMRGERIGENEG